MIVARRSAISCGVISAYRSEAEHSLPLGRRGRFLSTENPGPKYSVRDSRIELALEGGDPRGKVISVSFQLDALFLADLGNLEGVEESEAGGEDGLLGEGGVDEVGARGERAGQ